MMEQRRMLMSQLANIEKAFQTATFIAIDGHSSGTNTGSAEINKSYFPNGKKYYLFGYYSNTFAIFSYYNGTIAKLYGINSLSLIDTGIALRLGNGTTGINANSIGLAALTFTCIMEDIFQNLSDSAITGLNSTGANYVTLTLSNYISTGEVKYLFVGSGFGFCVYKIAGTTYSDLTALFNHNLYLINYGSTSVRLSSNSSSYSNQYFYGYTAMCAKG